MVISLCCSSRKRERDGQRLGDSGREKASEPSMGRKEMIEMWLQIITFIAQIVHDDR